MPHPGSAIAMVPTLVENSTFLCTCYLVLLLLLVFFFIMIIVIIIKHIQHHYNKKTLLLVLLLLLIVYPNITIPVEGQEFIFSEGSDGSITCTATGYPPPVVTWRYSNGSIVSNMRLVSGSEVMSSTGVGNVTSVSAEFMITRAMREDTGIFLCLASNILSFNNTDITVTITIQCKYMHQNN